MFFFYFVGTTYATALPIFVGLFILVFRTFASYTCFYYYLYFIFLLDTIFVTFDQDRQLTCLCIHDAVAG